MKNNYKLAGTDTKPDVKSRWTQIKYIYREEENMIWDDVCNGEVTHSNVRNTRIAALFRGATLSQSPKGSAAIHPVPLARTLLRNCPINQCPGDGGAPPADQPAGRITCCVAVSCSAEGPIKDEKAKGPQVE